MLVEFILNGVENVFLAAVKLVPEWLTLVNFKCLHLGADLGNAVLVGFGCRFDVAANLVDFLAELVGRQVLEFWL